MNPEVWEAGEDVSNPGVLYIVATPIGNLDDISTRARESLASVNVIAAEDTRHSGVLLQRLGVRTPALSYHEHNERERLPELIALLKSGQSVALISDAGTPLVSDPGYHLVRAAQAEGIRVTPVPGPCAAIAALSVSGLPSDRFAFEGFPPARAAARLKYFQALNSEPRTLIFYESAHRIVESLQDMVESFGGTREALLARELTKQYETVRAAPLAELAGFVAREPNQQKGEFVIVLRGAPEQAASPREAERILRVLLTHMATSQAAAITAELTGLKRQELYDLALTFKK
jgi:16S rRNA (cytidine1402-2'-O)-methyltransferase